MHTLHVHVCTPTHTDGQDCHQFLMNPHKCTLVLPLITIFNEYVQREHTLIKKFSEPRLIHCTNQTSTDSTQLLCHILSVCNNSNQLTLKINRYLAMPGLKTRRDMSEGKCGEGRASRRRKHQICGLQDLCHHSL